MGLVGDVEAQTCSALEQLVDIGGGAHRGRRPAREALAGCETLPEILQTVVDETVGPVSGGEVASLDKLLASWSGWSRGRGRAGARAAGRVRRSGGRGPAVTAGPGSAPADPPRAGSLEASLSAIRCGSSPPQPSFTVISTSPSLISALI